MTDFNFDALETIERANPVKRAKGWRFKHAVRKNGERVFTFSQALFDELGLATKSLKVRHGGGMVVLEVYPENDGNWVKSSKKGTKGKTHKNNELTKLLSDNGITEESLDLQYLGEDPNSGLPNYQVVVYSEPTETIADDGRPQPEPIRAAESIADEPAIDEGQAIEDAPEMDAGEEMVAEAEAASAQDVLDDDNF